MGSKNYQFKVKISKSGRFKKFELNIPSFRVFYGISENHNIIEIKPTEQKFMTC